MFFAVVRRSAILGVLQNPLGFVNFVLFFRVKHTLHDYYSRPFFPVNTLFTFRRLSVKIGYLESRLKKSIVRLNTPSRNATWIFPP